MVRQIDDINDISGLFGIGPLPSDAPVAAFNTTLTESLLLTKGFNALHYKHAPSPNRETVIGPMDPNTQEAQWGFRFYQCRQLKLVPQNFSLENRLNVQGIWGLHTVMLNVTGYYTDNKDKEPVFCRPHDLIVMDTDPMGNATTIEIDQMLEYNPNGPMRLNFRVEQVAYLADRNRTYLEGQDFEIADGKINWLPAGRKPDFHGGKGAVLSIVYYAKPVYIVKNVPHAIRLLPSNPIGHGALPRKAEYAPQLVIGTQSWIRQDSEELSNFADLPLYPTYRNSPNVTGGTY